MHKNFIGRDRSLNALKLLLNKRSASLVVIRGRRRIGKSRLAEEFIKLFKSAYMFTGLPPEEKISATKQRTEFIRQLHEQRIPSTAQDDWGEQSEHISPYEFLKILAITGGVPRYLEEIQVNLTAEENIFRLCFQKEGVLFNEFDEIFTDLFEKRHDRYKNIVMAITQGNKTYEDIAKFLKRETGGDLSQQLEELCADGFIRRDYTWNIKSNRVSRKSQYRVSDNYLHFYLKYILPNKSKIAIDALQKLPLGWESIIGLQFENLVINNRKKLMQLLNVSAEELVMCNPFLQTQTKRYRKCQIGFVIQTKFNVLYICEIKFRKGELGCWVIEEMKEKIDRLVIPRGFSIRPVLIHVNGVTDELIEKNYFSKVVNFSSFLQKS